MKVTPYLMLYGRGAEAIEFYKKAVGATAGMVMQFKDAPDKSMITPGSENQGVDQQYVRVNEIVLHESPGKLAAAQHQ